MGWRNNDLFQGKISEQTVRDLPAKRRAARKVEMAAAIAESAKSATKKAPSCRVVPLPDYTIILGAPAHQFNAHFSDPNRCCKCGLSGAEGNHFGDFTIVVPEGALTAREAKSDPVQDFISRRIAKRESAKRDAEYQSYLSRPVQNSPTSPQAIALDRAMTIAAPIRYTHEFGNPKMRGF